MYGVYLLEYDRFIICRKQKIFISTQSYITEFFTGYIIWRGVGEYSEAIQPWKKGGEICLNGTKDSEMAYCVPISNLIDVNEITSEKDIICLYLNVNKHIRENPNYIYELMENEKNKMI